MKSIFSTSMQWMIVLLIIALFVSGCSGSSDPQLPTTSETANTEDEPSGGMQGSASETTDGSVNDPTDSTTQTPTDSTTQTSTDSTTQTSTDSTTQTPTDNTTQTTGSDGRESTRIEFDINVPAYVSDALQVRVRWADKEISAQWVVDESWKAVENFPINTQHLLTVTFYDNNGDTTLASYESDFKTGSNTSETYRITADQFDTQRWDDDGDGVSNLEESIAATNSRGDDAQEPVQASLELVADKTFRLRWLPSAGARYYRVLEDPDGLSGFNTISADLDASTQSFDHRVALYNRVNARYIVQACDSNGCVDSNELIVSGTLQEAIGYFKAGNVGASSFGYSVSLSSDGSTMAVSGGGIHIFSRNNGGWQQQAHIALSSGLLSLSADGDTLAIGSPFDQSAGTGINGAQNDNISRRSGAAFIWVRTNTNWSQQAYIKASNSDEDDRFGEAISLSASGDTLAVGSRYESSAATGIEGDQTDNSVNSAGAAYVFRRVDDSWQQQVYLKASKASIGLQGDQFGRAVSLSATGNTLVVGSRATGGAAFVFEFAGGKWEEQAFLTDGKASMFGLGVSLSASGNTLAIGALGDDSAASGINGDENDNSLLNAGAAYVFVRSNGNWQQQAYLKASNPDRSDIFGEVLSISADGNTLAVGAYQERSAARGINGDQTINSNYRHSYLGSGAVYVFRRSAGIWQQNAYVKASNTDPGEVTCELQLGDGNTRNESGDAFGRALSLSADGQTLAVGADQECSAAIGINGDQEDNSEFGAGAVYLY